MFSDVLRCFWCSQDALICSQMCSDDLRCSEDQNFLQIFSRCSLDVFRMFSACSDGPCEHGGSGGSGRSFGSSRSCGSSISTIVGLVGLVSLIGWVGLEGMVSLVGIFFLFGLIQKYFQIELLSFTIHKNLTIPKPLIV